MTITNISTEKKRCNKCRKLNHFTRVCQSKPHANKGVHYLFYLFIDTKSRVDGHKAQGRVTPQCFEWRFQAILGDPGAVSQFQVRAEEPLGTLSYKTSSKQSQCIWLVPEILCVFLPNQSEVCFRILSCVLTPIYTRSLVAHLVCLGHRMRLCSRWKVSVSAHNVREIY